MINANKKPLSTRLLDTFFYYMASSEEQKTKEDKSELNFFERIIFFLGIVTILVIATPACIALRFWAASLTAIFYWPIQEYSAVNLVVFLVMAAMATTIQLMSEDR